ncbi:hypothetical protein RRG08_060517 [Elysia crispata]|uniref:Uncharacterized protein n=1 Tax=Elysia crispata TaxID=231223 RepID=A0AAE1AAS9_9GAST|nr:hypothetical protein RRG08_060517 [Elysia crispata]
MMYIYLRLCFVLILMVAPIASWPYYNGKNNADDNFSGEGEVLNADDNISGDGEVLNADDNTSGDGEVLNADDNTSGDGEVLNADDNTSGDGEVLNADDNTSGDGEVLNADDNTSGDGEVLNADDNTSGDGEVLNADDNTSGDGEVLNADDNTSGDGEVPNADDNTSGEVLDADDNVNGHSLFIDTDEKTKGDEDAKHSLSIFEKNIEIRKSLHEIFYKTTFKETIIFIKASFKSNHLLYIRGGNPNATGCTDSKEPKNDPCAIPIRNIFLGMNIDTYARDYQSEGDHYLSWAEREDHQSEEAKGTPAVLTTNDASQRNFCPLNKFGPDYWMVRFEVDCSSSYNGFFEVKGYYEGLMETDVTSSTCSGEGATNPPIHSSTGGHIARCGYMNVFTWGKPDCQILDIPPE